MGFVNIDLTPVLATADEKAKEQNVDASTLYPEAIQEYVSSLNSELGEYVKNLPPAEIKSAVDAKELPVTFDYTFMEEISQGYGGLVDKVTLDLEHLKKNPEKHKDTISAINKWVGKKQNGYYEAMSPDDLKLYSQNKIPESLAETLTLDMKFSGLSKEKFDELVEAHKAGPDQEWESENISREDMDKLVESLAKRDIPLEKYRDKVAVPMRDEWPSKPDQDYPKQAGKDEAKMMFYLGAVWRSEGNIRIGVENSRAPNWPQLKDQPDHSVWFENGFAKTEIEDISDKIGTVVEQDGNKQFKFNDKYGGATVSIDEDGCITVPASTLQVDPKYNYPAVASLSVKLSEDEMKEVLTNMMARNGVSHENDNCIPYSGRKDGGCTDQALASTIPASKRETVDKIIGPNKGNAVTRCNAAIDNVTAKGKKLEEGIYTNTIDPSKAKEGDLQGYDHAFQSVHEQIQGQGAGKEQKEKRNNDKISPRFSTVSKVVAAAVALAAIGVGTWVARSRSNQQQSGAAIGG